MPFELKLAWKYFRSARKGLVRFTSAVAVLGIAIGVASLIIAQALSNGFANEIQSKILSNTAHIAVTEIGDAKISNWQIVKRKLEEITGVVDVEATIYESAVLSHDDKTSYAVLRVKESNDKNVGDRSGSEITISIGKGLADKLDLKPGDETEILTLQNEETPTNASVRVGNVFETGLYEYDSTWIYISAKEYTKLKDRREFVPAVFGVYVKDIFRTDETTKQIKQILGGSFEVLDWREANKPLFSALSLERKVSFGIILLIIFIAALNITTTLALLINERKTDVAILRTCGAKTKALVVIFLLEGIILSSIGIFTGAVLGVLGCVLGNYFRVVSISEEVYELNYVPFHFSIPNILIIVLIAFLVCFFAMIYPVLRVSKIKPLENIRNA